MAGGTPGNSQISNSIMPTQNNRLQQQRMPQQQSGTIGGISTDMGMSTNPYAPPKTPTQQAGSGWGNQYWGSNGGSTQPQTGGGYPMQNGGYPTQGGGGAPMPQPTQPTQQPIQFGSYPGYGGQQQQSLDMWAIASGQQAYPQAGQGQQVPPAWQPPPGQQPSMTGPTGGVRPPFSFEDFMGLSGDGGIQKVIGNYANMELPYLQHAQNAYQYGMDFGESQRRYDINTALQYGNDQAAQNIANRQQWLSENQARIANEQWGQQFAHVQQNDYFNQGMSVREQQEAERAARAQEALGWGQQDTQRYGIDVGAASDRYRVDAQTGLGYYQTDAQTASDRYRTDAQTGLGYYQTNAQTGLGYAQVGQDRYATDVGAATDRYRTDAQTGLGYANIGLGHSELQMRNRITQLEQSGLDRRTAMDIASRERISSGEQAGLDRRQTEALAAQERMATMQNYGRAMAPGAKWIRNW